MGCLAFFIMIKFMIALPNHPAILASGMPDLAAIETAALTTDNLSGERAATRFIAFFLLSFFQLMLNEIIDLWGNDSGVAIFNIVLGNFPLVGFLFLGEKIDGVGLLVEAMGVERSYSSVVDCFNDECDLIQKTTHVRLITSLILKKVPML